MKLNISKLLTLLLALLIVTLGLAEQVVAQEQAEKAIFRAFRPSGAKPVFNSSQDTTGPRMQGNFNDRQPGKGFLFGERKLKRIVYPHFEDLESPSAFTISAWVFPTSYREYGSVSKGHVIFSRYQGNNTGHFMLQLTAKSRKSAPGRLHFMAANGGKKVKFASRQSVPLKRWSHVAATFYRGKVALYLDGKKVASGETPFTRVKERRYERDDLNIGNHRPGAHDKMVFRGRIDEVRFYTKALTGKDINRLVSEGRKSHS